MFYICFITWWDGIMMLSVSRGGSWGEVVCPGSYQVGSVSTGMRIKLPGSRVLPPHHTNFLLSWEWWTFRERTHSLGSQEGVRLFKDGGIWAEPWSVFRDTVWDACFPGRVRVTDFQWFLRWRWNIGCHFFLHRQTVQMTPRTHILSWCFILLQY